MVKVSPRGPMTLFREHPAQIRSTAKLDLLTNEQGPQQLVFNSRQPEQSHIHTGLNERTS
jgi:hypothetical protein